MTFRTARVFLFILLAISTNSILQSQTSGLMHSALLQPKFVQANFVQANFVHTSFVQSSFVQSQQGTEDKNVPKSQTPATGPAKAPASPAKAPKSAQTAKKTSPTATPTPMVDEKLFNGMKWRQVGPFRGGRVLAVTGVPGEPNVFYFGGASGGVWKSVDTGESWQPIFDKQNIASIGSIAVAESDHNVIYVGTGEACIRGNITYGNGVYKSVDGGKSWKSLGLKDTRHIGAVIVDPRNPNIVFVAALGHAYGPNEERGLYRSTDGGATWQRVLYKDNKTGAIDVVFDPNNSNTLFASLWEVYRTPWSLNSGGPGSGLYKSTDGGATWTRLEGHGLPPGIMGRIGISVGADSNRVYAMVESKEGGL
jgi:photosystem II stability/assembly factor-like uncharacterized protein